jgi:4-amino-4-deoxy-L-arabinose transferase-like glycosyltransferase
MVRTSSSFQFSGNLSERGEERRTPDVVNRVEPRTEHRTLATRTVVIRDVLILLTLVGIAAALRLYRLDSLPPGFDVDEAYNMLDALDIVRGKHPVFLPANAGREALYSYLQAFMVLILGKQVFALRLTSALIGIVTVGATYVLVSNLPVCRVRALALLTALLLALSFYHLTFSRYGIRSIMTPLVECLAFYAYWRGCQGLYGCHTGDHGLASPGLAFGWG